MASRALPRAPWEWCQPDGSHLLGCRPPCLQRPCRGHTGQLPWGPVLSLRWSPGPQSSTDTRPVSPHGAGSCTHVVFQGFGEDADGHCDTIAAIAEVIKLTDPSLLYLEVSTLVSKYPDIR